MPPAYRISMTATADMNKVPSSKKNQVIFVEPARDGRNRGWFDMKAQTSNPPAWLVSHQCTHTCTHKYHSPPSGNLASTFILHPSSFYLRCTRRWPQARPRPRRPSQKSRHCCRPARRLPLRRSRSWSHCCRLRTSSQTPWRLF